MIGTPYQRRFIRIRAEDVPNIRRALQQIKEGKKPDGKRVLPGLMAWEEYLGHRTVLPKARQCVVLDAEWWAGAEEFLTPKEWLVHANEYASRRPRIERGRGRKWLGVDSGGGGDASAWVCGDEHGIVDIVERKTPDTNEIYGMTCLLARKWSVAWGDVWYDFGGGGKQMVDRHRAANHPVNGVDFGARMKVDLKRGMTQFTEKRDAEEEKAAFDMVRSEMAWEVRMLLERPAPLEDMAPEILAELHQLKLKPEAKKSFALPLPMCEELCRQLGLIPMKWDDKGRFKLMPKTNPNDPDDPRTLKSIIGRSPDTFDAFCCMVHGLNHKSTQQTAGTS